MRGRKGKDAPLQIGEKRLGGVDGSGLRESLSRMVYGENGKKDLRGRFI